MKKTNNKFNFTIKSIEALPVPTKGRAYYYDTNLKGLGLSVTVKGVKSFIVYKKIHGKPERITLGQFPITSVEEARKKATSALKMISDGLNPNKEKLKLSKEITLEKLLEQYIHKYAKIHKKTWEDDYKIFKRYLMKLANSKISTISKSDIELLHVKIGNNNGKYAANRTLSLLQIMYNKAISWGWEGENPCAGIKKFKEKTRDRFIQPDEIANFFEALNDEPNETFKDFLYISLLTGARRSNVLSMSWLDINFERSVWVIQETKNGDSLSVPLVPQAIEILRKRYNAKVNDWVFYSSNSKSGHIEEPKNVWQRLLIRAGIKDLRIHDLRRTLGSWQAANGANSYIIGKSLGHKTQQATAIYARLNLDPVRDSMEKAAEGMLSSIKLKK